MKNSAFHLNLLSEAEKMSSSPIRLRDSNGDAISSALRNGLWATVKERPRAFDAPGKSVSTRVDLSWDAEVAQ